MSFDNNYFSADHNEYHATPLSNAGRGFLRLVLLFGSAAAAMALIIVPILNDQASKVAAQSVLPDAVDRTMTGSINRDIGKRDIVNQPQAASPSPVCVIEVNGRHHGAC